MSFDVTDPDSPIIGSDGCETTTVTTDTSTAGVTLTCTATSEGGTSSESVTIRRDGTGPTVTCPADARFLLGEDAVIEAAVTDEHSGPAADVVTAAADTATAGAKVAELTGSDLAGNVTTVECGYIEEPTATASTSATRGSSGYPRAPVTAPACRRARRLLIA